MGTDTLKGYNRVFPIYDKDGAPFHNLVLRTSVADSVVMSLGDKITGDVYYKDNTLAVTMLEYIEYKQNPEDENEEPIRYSLVNPPTVVREGMVADNGELKGMTKYSFEFYHPMYQLSNFPFTDVATKTGEEKYLSQNKSFSWIGKPQDYIDKLNKNLQGTVWYVRKSSKFPQDKDNELSEVLTFDNVTIADAIKTGYETWDIPYVVSEVSESDPLYAHDKRFVVEYGLPSNEIYASESDRQTDTPYVFRFGQGVGLKNNSRTPRNNKIVTRIAGYGSEDNVPYGYPQIVWTGNQDWDYTIDNNPNDHNSYPIYKGIVGGQYVKLIKHPFTRTHLMPSIYTETVNKKVNPNAVGYNPNIEIKDYYDAIATQEYPYTNEINPQAPSYESHEFADIKPELDADRNTGIVSAVPLNADLTPADHWDDSMDDNGKYLQEYFKITLPQLSFDLYACAAITQEMQINMRGGYCIGCTFTVQVDWDDYKKNFYDSDGNFLPDGEQRDLTKYPKSNLGQISVVVQKDNSTFGTLMPNIYQQPKSDDLFVFIGISLPTSYITNAEIRLDAAMKSYMLENNVYYFDYPLKFDEHFLATHTYILEQIRPNSIIHFDYGGVEQQLFVKQLTVKYGNAPLPQYDITLTDNVEVVLNQIGQVADDVEKLSSLIAILRQSYNRNVWIELAKKLSKTQDDTAQGFIRFVKGLQVGNMFTSGILGEGGVFRKDADGKTYIEADKLYVRMKAYFDSVEVREYQHTSGNRIASQAKGFTASRVEWLDADGNITDNINDVVKFRCYWRAKDDEHEAENQFVIGDQAFMEYSDIVDGNLIQKRFWRVVVGRNVSLTEDGEAWIDLSNKANDTITYIDHQGTSRTQGVTGCEAVATSEENLSSIPQPEDDICQLGNVWDTERQGAIIEYVSGGDAPSYQIFQGIDSFSLNGRNYISLGYSSQKGRAYINVYGDAYIGDKPDAQGNAASYIRYNSTNKKLTIKADVDIQSTFGGKTFNEAIGGTTVIKDLQNQIDGAIESWFLNGAPVDKDGVLLPSHEPYATWLAKDTKTDEETGETIIVNTERLKHLGDLYYDNETGYAYRFANTGTETNPVFTWQRISDTDIVKALETAQKAQTTAEGKRTVYSVWGAWVKDGVNTLEVGDLFIPVSDTTQGGVVYKANKVYKCTAKGANTFTEINYTDDSKFNGYISQILNGTTETSDSAVVAQALHAIKTALGENTQIDGGLILTNLITMRQDNAVWAGISGQYKETESVAGQYKGHGIAAWYGGAMIDREVNTTATDFAKSLFRFDGSGYLASGNITWDKDGRVAIKDITTLIGSSNTNILNELTTFNNAFHFNTQQGTTTVLSIVPQVGFTNLGIIEDGTWKPVATKEWVNKNFLTTSFFDELFQLYNKTTKISPNGTIPADKTNLNIKAMFGFWTEKYISALGKNDGGGSSGGIDMTTVWSALANNTSEQINASHLSTALSTYATQSWVQQQISGYTPSSTRNIIVNGDSYTVNSPYNTDINLDSTYLKMSSTEQRITSTISSIDIGVIQLYRTGGNGNWCYLGFANNDSDGNLQSLGLIGFETQGVLKLRNSSGSYKVWHEGNDGSDSGLDADLLDGQHSSYYAAASSLNGYLPLTGGTMTGNLTVSGTYEPHVRVYKSGVADDSLLIGESGNHGLYTVGKGFWCFLDTSGNGHFVGNADSATTSAACSGNSATATTASKLSIVSKTAWGQTYWTRDGIPTNISGSMTGVGDITSSSSYSLRDSSSNPYLNLKVGSQNWFVQGLSDGIYIGSAQSESLKIDASGNVTVAGTFWVSGATTLSTTLSVSGLLTANGGINIPSGKTLTIGDAVLSWDSTNQGIKITKGLYSETFISALGANSSGGSGGIDITTVWSALAGNTTEQINASHLTTALSGYATQSWVNQQISAYTPDLSNYLPLSGGTMTGVLHTKHVFEVYNGSASSKRSAYMKFTRNGVDGNDYAALGWNGSNVRLTLMGGDGNYTSEHDALLIGYNGQLKLQAQNGIAPITTSSTTLVTNLNADMLDGQHGSYYAAASSLNNYLPLSGGVMTGNISFRGSGSTYQMIKFKSSADAYGQGLVLGGGGLVAIGGGESQDVMAAQCDGSNERTLIGNDGDVEIYTALQNGWDSRHSFIFNTNGMLTMDGGQSKAYQLRVTNGSSTSNYWHKLGTFVTAGNSHNLVINIYSGDGCNGEARQNSYVRIVIKDGWQSPTSVTNCLGITCERYGNASQIQVRVNVTNRPNNNSATGDVWVLLPWNHANGNYTIEGQFASWNHNSSTSGDTTTPPTHNQREVMYLDNAYLTSNVASATKLQTPRTIWGQSFDGTGNVDGNITVTGNGYFTGNVGIGTTSPSYTLHVSGSLYCNAFTGGLIEIPRNNNVIQSVAGCHLYINHDRNSNVFLCTGGGNVGIGTTSTSYKLNVAGVIYSAAGIFSDGYVSALGQNTSSDIRKKDIKENFALSVDDIAAAPSVRYLWKDNRELGVQVGSIAQYWQNVLPEAIHEDSDGYLTMQYGVIALLASIATARKVEDHERRIKELEKECERLRTEVEQLRMN